MFNRSKGITPVIAIVLLLLITVGAVGVVYTQFQGLVEGNDAQDELQQNQKIQQSSYSIIAVTQSSSNYEVTIKNTGDEVIDLSTLGTLQIGKDGAQPRAVSSYTSGGCSLPSSLSSGGTYSCETGVSWGNANDGAGTKIQLQVGETIKATSTCYEDGSGSCGS